ncbi:PREDICTED: interferon-induced transmembrane protein 1-like [Nanorana parkeri]|uniref:interferon-induced transmembrane protein 1-like n=1 Tax=Nanorana parkeri TaxID=125878 RepID=UPI0008542B55|nr:PREDICTED: interferon-induced transmembrane protein 1-like [Nanorana parkeri]
METDDKESPSQHVMETSANMLTYCKSKEDELLKVEMTPLQVASGQKESTVLTVTSNQLPERDHIIWSIFNTIYMNFCCLGFIALIFSIKSRDQKVNGKQNEARQYSTTARWLNIFSTVLTILWFLITVIVIIYNFVRMKAAIRSWLGL